MKDYIEREFNKFFEFDTDDKSYVTSVSCKLFAEHLFNQLYNIAEDACRCVWAIDNYRYLTDDLLDDEIEKRDRILQHGLDARNRLMNLINDGMR